MHIELEWLAFTALVAFAAFSILFLSRHSRRKAPDLSPNLLYRIEDVSFPMLLANTNGTIVRTNSLLTDLFGYAEHELDGQSLEVLVPEMHRGSHAQLRNDYVRAPHPRPMAQRILYGLRKDGHTIPIEIGLSTKLSSQGLLIAATVNDATAKLHWEDKLLTTNAFLSSIIHCAPFSIIATDLDGNITAVSPAAERMLWYSEKELLHKHSPQLIHDASEVNHRARELSVELGETISGFEVFVAKARLGLVETREWTYIRKDGSRFQVELTVTALRGADERMVGFMGIAYDISERKRKDEYIHFLAHHDVLTGLPNRTLLQDRLDMAIERARRFGQKVGLILVDLDHFKRVNDSMGHHTGDQLLIEVAKRLQAGVRSIDTVARMGGDEFVIVITDIDEPASLVPLAEKLEREIAEPIDAGMHRLRITASIGVCLYPDDGDNAAVLLRHADVAMYEAKAEGRDTVKSFSLRMAHAITERVELERELRNAIDMQQFQLVYQPILSLRSGDVVAVEALLRWYHPTLGSIPPNIFIPVAEDSGLIVPIGEWVLRTACTQARHIQQLTGRSLLMCVNLSPRQLSQPNIADVVQMALADSNLPAQTLELEITENVLIDQTDNAARQLADIRRLGVRIAIDDFGTGYSSLAYITQFPIDKIKIDRSFVRNLGDEGHSRTVINAIIAMAQGLNVEVTAEGIETDMQREYLTESHCDHGQGFLFGHPVPAAELPALLAHLAERAISPAV